MASTNPFHNLISFEMNFAKNSSLKYGLNKKGGSTAANSMQKKSSSIFSDDNEQEDELAVDLKKQLIDRSLKNADKLDAAAIKALKDDPNIFDYDGAYENIDVERKKATAKKVETQEAPVSNIYIMKNNMNLILMPLILASALY
jgi:hypothetical protein